MPVTKLRGTDADLATPYHWNQQVTSDTLSPSTQIDSGQLQANYDAGFRDGEARGRSNAAGDTARALAEAISNLATARQDVFRAAQKDILKLSIGIAQRILHREIHLSKDVLSGVISAALDRIQEQDLIVVRIHPSIEASIQELIAARPLRAEVRVEADATLPLGGCIIETEQGSVDAGIESQLSEIERGLADHLGASW